MNRIAIAKRRLHIPYHYWSVPVRVGFTRGCRYTLFRPFLGSHDSCFKQTTGLTKGLKTEKTGTSAHPRRKTQTQIPITLLPDLTPVPHPAVSSLEAS